MEPKILAISGSTRTESLNKKLLMVAAGAAREGGAAVTVLELRELGLPLYDGDDEQRSGLPAGALRLKQIMKEHQAVLISAPEYNSSISGVLKNAIDWASRPVPGQPPLEAFNNKVAALLAASPGRLGGLRGLVHLRSILGNINVLVLPQQFALNSAAEAFDAEGKLKDAKQLASVRQVTDALVTATRKFCL